MRNVFILGAGASRTAGGPLMYDFLDRADSLSRHKGDWKPSPSFKLVSDLVSELRSVHAKSFLDLDNIEVLLGAIEMGQLIDKLGHHRGDGISGVRDAIVEVIVETLERSIRFPVNHRQIHAPTPYDSFVHTLDAYFQANQSRRDVAFLTFNYDVVLEVSLVMKGITFDYCLEEDSSGTIPVLKLHGSLNWGRCSKCSSIVPSHVHDAHFDLYHDPKHVFYDLGSNLQRVEHCGAPLSGPPVIVPPTWNKTEHHRQLERVWKRAVDALSLAENIFVIGYSLPESDSFFRYLYALGSDSDTRIKRFWVVNPDEDGSVEQRFREMTGRGIERRLRFLNGDEGTFGAAIGEIAEALHDRK